MMKNDDYRTEFEEQRQEINMNEDHNGEILSRVELHRKGRKAKKRSGPKLINILFGLFTLIPVGILIYVVFSWNSPKSEPNDKVQDSQFQFETSGKSSDSVDVVDEDDDVNETSTEEAAEQARKEQEEQARKAEAEQARKAQEEQVKKDEAAAAEKAREEQAKKEQEKKEEPAPRTHTVAAGETLYRISVNYYKSGDGVSKIIQANGLSSNEIVTGQKLVIP